jgi:DNA-binding response OmpR family regulator
MDRRFSILVIDDDAAVLAMLRIMLTQKGFDVVTAQDALTGLRSAYEIHPDAILLDVMMPEMNGFETCRRLREFTDVPIIFVTAKGTIEDIVHGLSLGADDYLVKPFNHTELISRLMTCLRRSAKQAKDESNSLFPAASMTLDCDRHEMLIGNLTVFLTPKEFEILRLMIHHAGKVLSVDTILTKVWGSAWVGEPDLVKQYIYRLRQKIEQDPKAPRYLQTVRGKGYCFVSPPEDK